MHPLSLVRSRCACRCDTASASAKQEMELVGNALASKEAVEDNILANL